MVRSDEDLSCFPDPSHLHFVIEDEELHVLHPTASWKDLLFVFQGVVRADLQEGHRSLCLRCAVHVDDGEVRGDLPCPQHVPLDEHITHKEGVLEAGDLGCGIGAQQLTHGRRQVSDSDLVIGAPLSKTAWGDDILLVWDAELGAEEEGGEHVALDGVMRNAREHCEPVLLRDAKLLPHPWVEVGEGDVPAHHPLGDASCAGGEAEGANVVGAHLDLRVHVLVGRQCSLFARLQHFHIQPLEHGPNGGGVFDEVRRLLR
mmetsp:Transcript_11789/g.21388  ORF Transcript_11789/g.21388 Transcript_11789/m.21388 type:complete len:259 (+) Transcript_11789:3200-3976(+)